MAQQALVRSIHTTLSLIVAITLLFCAVGVAVTPGEPAWTASAGISTPAQAPEETNGAPLCPSDDSSVCSLIDHPAGAASEFPAPAARVVYARAFLEPARTVSLPRFAVSPSPFELSVIRV